MRPHTRRIEWAIAIAEAAVVVLSAVAVYRLLGGGDSGVTGLLVVLVLVGGAWGLLLNPWSRWALPALTSAVVLAALSVLTAIALVMTGLFWGAAALVVGSIVLLLGPVLRPWSTGRHSRRDASARR